MKKPISAFILLFSIGIFASGATNMMVSLSPITATIVGHNGKTATNPSPILSYKAFEQLAKTKGIPHRKLDNLKDAKMGYYVISGVYSSEYNAKKYIKNLKKKGFNPKSISDPNTGLHYVYLAYYKEGQQAINACTTGFNGQFKEAVWIIASQITDASPTHVLVNLATPLSAKKSVPVSKVAQGPIADQRFLNAAKENNIPTRIIRDLKEVQQGYYVIAGVYGEAANALKSVAKFNKKGFHAKFLKVPATGLHYVYLDYRKIGGEAIAACANRMQGKYNADLWIIAVQHEITTDQTFLSGNNAKRASSTQASKGKARRQAIEDDGFLVDAKTNNIPTRTFKHLEGIKNGFYIIAGVYSDEHNAKVMAKKFKKKGYDANYINVPENGLNYLYLEYHTSGQKAIDACTGQMGGNHKEQLWIMKVEESDPADDILIAADQEDPFEELEPITDNKSSFDLPLVGQKQQQNQAVSNGNPNKSRLVDKADTYFDKMWYAEAAELYEEALSAGGENYTFDVIQKAADAHYFNTNMEKAYGWYNVLYEQYGEELSADNIFKYAHALKGTGKYSRAKKLMRLYNKKMEKGDISDYRGTKPTANEVALDNILGSTQNFEIKNMAINSKYSDFSPMFLDSSRVVYASAMDSSFLNTRRYKWNNQPYLDLYVAKVNEESQDLKDAIKFSKKINTKYHEASVTFSPDNTTMYFTRNNYGKKLKRDKKGVNNLKIYVSNKLDGDWTEAREVSFNSDDYSTGHPALSPDGKKLYFVSDMPGSIGKTDLFVVDVLGNGTFSEPKNLGPGINTEGREMFPFINDSKLYFSSDGHIGLGGLDVYEVAYDENGFKETVNVGQPVNSNKDDFSYIVNEKNQKGYFASNRAGGKGDDDIYSFKRLMLEETPLNQNAIAGVVTELITGDLMPKALVELLDENGIKLKEVMSDDEGSFVFEDLDSNTKYLLKTTKGEFFDIEQEVGTKDNEIVNIDVKLKRLQEMIAIEDGIKKLKTEMIYFDFDKSYIRKDASVELKKLVAVMKEYPTMVIKIESHTDSRGTRAYNRFLSDKRAKSTREYIISQGIDPSRIQSAAGYGEEQLLNGCNGSIRCTEQQHFQNRRSEFIIVNM